MNRQMHNKRVLDLHQFWSIFRANPPLNSNYIGYTAIYKADGFTKASQSTNYEFMRDILITLDSSFFFN